jgi:hypothetical protein
VTSSFRLFASERTGQLRWTATLGLGIGDQQTVAKTLRAPCCCPAGSVALRQRRTCWAGELRSGSDQIAKASSSNATTSRLLTGSSTVSS